VQGWTVIPHQQIVRAPFVHVNELRLGGVLGEIAQQQPRLGGRHANDAADMR
jgi:hypothetical protein